MAGMLFAEEAVAKEAEVYASVDALQSKMQETYTLIEGIDGSNPILPLLQGLTESLEKNINHL